jgi:hypothetical protein
MAQPIIVTAVTTESGAALGPSENHGTPPYSEKEGDVKGIQTRKCRGRDASRGFEDAFLVDGSAKRSARTIEHLIATLRNL